MPLSTIFQLYPGGLLDRCCNIEV